MARQLIWDEGTTDLAFRSGGGVEIALLWTRATGRVAVGVFDAALGGQFEVAVAEGQSPLDVFEHPFAYAAPRGGEPVAAA